MSKLKKENFNKAVEICAAQHSTRITFNHIPHNSNFVPDAINIVIHESCAAVINNLIEAGFSLSMGKEGLHISDYSVKTK